MSTVIIIISLLTITILTILFYFILKRNIKVYYENCEGAVGGHETVSIFKMFWWLYFGRINPREKSDKYYIRKIETDYGDRI